MNIWLTMAFLQIMDFFTTIIFLLLGVSEANLLARFFLRLTNPLLGFLIFKASFLILMFLAWYLNRIRAVIWANYFYMAVVLWNTFVILARIAGQ